MERNILNQPTKYVRKMLLFWVLNVFMCFGREALAESAESDESADFGGKLIERMKNDANLDLPVDDEYEDLRAELLAYHTAFASLTSGASRRSMKTTACWELGGICVNYKLCSGFRYLTQVPGCKNRHDVCCFTWNRFKVSDFRDKGIGTNAMPWPLSYTFGGEGVQVKEPEVPPKKKKKKKLAEDAETVIEEPDNEPPDALAIVIKTH